MDYLKISEVANKWNMSERRIQDLCKSGRIPGVVRWGRAWMIPADAIKPIDARNKALLSEYNNYKRTSFPKDNPFLIYTNLYNTAGTAETTISSLSELPEIEKIIKAQFDYHQGKIEKIYEDANFFLKTHSGFNAIVSASILLSFCAIWQGDVNLWLRAKKHLCEAPCRNDSDREILSFWLAVMNSSVYDISEFPEWFKIGVFDVLPADTYCVARVYYVKYLFIVAHDIASGKKGIEGVRGLGLIRILPYIIEPMTSQAKMERTILPEIYLHLMCATAYHNLGQDEKAVPHVDKAIELCLPDKLYCVLAEYRKNLDLLLDDRLALVDVEVLKKVKKLSKQFVEGWVKLHNVLLSRNISIRLSPREYEAAKYAAFGLSNSEIAKRMHLSESSVKTLVSMAKNKTGALKRSDLGTYI